MFDRGYKMDFNKVKVIATTNNYRSRLIRETIDIEKNRTVNIKEWYHFNNT